MSSLSIAHVTERWPFRPMPIGWHEEEWQYIKHCNTLADLVPVAHRVIDRFRADMPVALVSGPISTGGILKPGTTEADISANLKRFNEVVEGLLRAGLPLFNQMPFEDIMVPINREWKAKFPDQYCFPILEEFYRGVFEYGRLRGIILIPGWESSFGANWEVNLIKMLGKEVIHLPVDWHESDPQEVVIRIAMRLAKGSKYIVTA